LVHSFRDSWPWSLDSVAPEQWESEHYGREHSAKILTSKQKEERRKGPGTRHALQKDIPSDLLPPARLYFLMIHSAMNSRMG
jgi:hypothetical protein